MARTAAMLRLRPSRWKEELFILSRGEKKVLAPERRGKVDRSLLEEVGLEHMVTNEGGTRMWEALLKAVWSHRRL